MKIARTCSCALAATLCAAAASSAHGRSLIHYFDFDTPSGNGLAYTGVDKGTRPANFTLKGSSVPRTTGALGSDYAYYSSAANTAIWLGDGSNSLGCGTTKGFTISFWLKTSGSHTAWHDFFGFRVGGLDYRCEYTTGNTSAFTVYYNVASTATCPFVGIPGASSTAAAAPAGVWKHAAFVFTPNGTNNIATCALYVGGEKIGYVNLRQSGDLQQIHVGTWVRALNGADRKSGAATNTGIDELAVFDYPVTAEQVKWLAKYKPAQPASGPGRAMPICWLLDVSVETPAGNGLQATNSGTGPWSAYKWYTGYADWITTGPGALNSPKAFHLKSKTTFRVDSSADDGLGATLGSGMTLSFWVMAPQTIASLWTDFMGFRIGNRYERFEWDQSTPVGFHIYGTSGGSGDPTRVVSLKANTWQHVCMVWNEATSRFEFYLDGVKQGHHVPLSSPNVNEALKTFILGTKVYNEKGGERETSARTGTYVDEVAIFNHSVSPAQIQWLTNNVPCLPPFDTTNLVRTVSANGAWAGGLASWTVREWDDANGAWANTTRTTIYPALEDTEVEVAVALADGVELTNDTFVTPKKLAIRGSGTLAASATLKAAADSRFAPEALEIGEGLQLTVPLYAVNVVGTLTLGTGSKITFDVSNYDGIGEVALTAGGIALPSGETDALTHFAVTDNRFELSLSADGKTVYAKLNNVAATATWTGAGDGTSLDSAANWECRNGSGVVLQNALPCELTRVIVCSGSTALNAPAGTTIPWQYLRIEAGNATLAADSVDWRGIPVLCVPEGVTVDLNGKELHLNGKLDGKGTITSSVAGGELHIDVPEGSSTTNATVAFTGSLKLVKDGDGTFTAACAKQAYTGGTEIADGTLKLGTSNLPLGAKNASVKICAGAVYDMNGCFSTSSCIYAYDLAGTFRSKTNVSGGGYNTSVRILGGTFVVSGDDARLELSNVYFACPDTTPAMFTMNGYTLTFDGTGYVGLGAFRSNDYGKWVFTDGDCLYEWLNGYGPNNVDVEVYAPARFKLNGNADVCGLVYEATSWSKNQVVSHLLVLGRYVAGPCHLPIQMCNGSTLDLSKITGSFDLTNAVANTAAASSGVIGDMTFQSGTAEVPSVINVNLAGKTDLIAIKNSESPYVVTWPSQPANVDFVIDAQSHADGYRIYPEAGGLRLKRFMGVMILVR